MAIKQNFPDIKPSLNLDFANTKSLDPRIDFTRASTATYYDGETFAKAEENLLTFSQEVAGWAESNSSIPSNSETAPDGTSTAFLVQEDTTNNDHYIQNFPGDIEGTFVYSVFVKSYSSDRFVMLAAREQAVSQNYICVDLSDGTVTEIGNNITNYGVISVGNGWYRLWIERTFGTFPGYMGLGLVLSDTPTPGSSSYGYVGNGTSGVYVWGAQVEQRDQVTAYTPTTDQPITNYIPVLKTAAPNEPRFDHDPVTGESKGLLIEEQRTNLLDYSEAFSNAFWEKSSGAVISTNQIIAPDGTQTADLLYSTQTGVAKSRLSPSNLGFGNIGSGNRTVSIYIKQQTGSNVTSFSLYNPPNSNMGATLDLSTGVATSYHPDYTVSSVNVGNGWYRFTVTTVSTFGSVGYILFDSNPITLNFTGPTNGVFIWGAQLEEGSFPTSYIKTEGSQVTRVKDSAQITGNNLDSWLRLDEGTFDVNVIKEFDTGSLRSGHILGFLNSEGTRRSSGFSIYLRDDTVRFNQPNAKLFDSSGSPVAIANSSVADTGNNEKNVSVAYSLNDLALTEEVGTLNTDDFGSRAVGDVDTFLIGENIDTAYRNRVSQMHIKRLTYYPKRLPNAVLQTLTEE